MKVHHINCGSLIAPGSRFVPCHCLLLESNGDLALVDTGIGLLDVQNPEERIGSQLIELAGFQFNEQDTAARKIERLGFRANDVRHILLTHGDPDHTGGLADFPHAQVHIAQEELDVIQQGGWRYRAAHFTHGPSWKAYGPTSSQWYGLEARPIAFDNGATVLLIPLFGHTRGHCGVAIRQGGQWFLHAGDAYYLRGELETDDHPVSALTSQRAEDNPMRVSSLGQLRRLRRDHPEVMMCCYHDRDELPSSAL